MYRWYKNAYIYYAYLSDVSAKRVVRDSTSYRSLYTLEQFGMARYFSRGWTLQELIAPSIVEFYDVDWTEIGTKSSLREVLSRLTGIDIRVLDGADPSICNAAERLSWASSRTTTRVEDAAYCMLGIFNIFLPLVYGEGERAFRRLQEEILKITEDYTLLAWDISRSEIANRMGKRYERAGPLAERLSDFTIPDWTEAKYTDIIPDVTISVHPPTVMNDWLRISIPVKKISDSIHLAYLYCRHGKTNNLLCMPLVPINRHLGGGRYRRGNVDNRWLIFVQRDFYEYSSGDSRLTTIWIALGSSLNMSSVPNLPMQRENQLSNFPMQITMDMTGCFEDYIISPNWDKNETEAIERLLAPSSANPVRSKSRRYHQWNVIGNDFYFLNISLEVKVSLLETHCSSEDDFAVRFGVKNKKLWCAILHGTNTASQIESTDGQDLLMDVDVFSPEYGFRWRLNNDDVPKILIDRATVTLPCAEISVTTRMIPYGVDVKIVIKQQAVEN